MKTDRILFVRPYSPVTHESLCPPLGLMYLASCIRELSGKKREIRIIDMRVDKMTLEDICTEISHFAPDFVGISALSHEAGVMHDLAGAVRAYDRNIPVVAGGPHASMFYDRVLQDQNVDAVVVGEGEQTILEILDVLENDGDIGGINGVASRDNKDGFRFLPRTFLENLDSLPFPAWDLIDIDGYTDRPNMNTILKGKRYMAILTSRGCPYGCAYCHNIFGLRFRQRSAENVLEEMRILRKEYGVDEFHIVDDIFNLDKTRAHTICDGMIRERLNVSFAFPNGLRGDVMDRPLIEKMVRAGCYSMTYAVETASPRIQRLLNKNADLERLKRVIEWSDQAGVITKSFFMLGFPTETPEEIEMTVDFALKSRLLLAGFFCVVPFPRTRLFELAVQADPTYAPAPENCFYYAEEPFYTRCTGFDVKAVQRRAHRSFYLNPLRLTRLFLRLPRKQDLVRNLKPFLQLAFGWILLKKKKKIG